MKRSIQRLALTAGTALLLATGQVSAFESTHTFTLDDLVGGFDGRTYGTDGNYTDPTIICGLTDTCPDLLPDGSNAPQPFLDKSGTWLYPVDSEFGFYVVDFASAFQKTDDGVYTEGFAGNIVSDGQVVGLAVSNAATDTFRVPAPLGTWCSGIGGSSVKCSTEHYVVMEHVKSCHETVPYITGQDDRADPITGVQAILNDPDGNPLVNCEDTKLDNALKVVGGVFDDDGTLLFPEGTLIESEQILYDGTDGYLVPNESTIINNIAATSDFSVTAKDDGKPLYRWGDLIKRPNDIRLYARMELPPEWYESECLTANGGLGCRVHDAKLYLDHLVTNNPNDQVRPEDMENEGATGRKPGYFPVASLGLIADTACFEGDGDYLPPSTLYENTLLQNLVYPYDGLDPLAGDPYAWSEDLQLGLSNGWYTTVDREPFEWAYDENGDGAADYSSPVPLETEDTLLSGPRWRLTAQKFGQDVPGLEIPVEECSPPPYQKDNIKYEVGAPITTVLDMLDWESDDERSVVDPDSGEHVSPLAFSNGWVSAAANDGAAVNEEVEVQNEDLEAVSVNGLPLSNGFDLSVYVKGDKKATAIYSATLVINAGDPSTGDIDVAAVSLNVPGRITAQNESGRTRTIDFTVSNVATEATAVDVEVCGVAGSVYAECFAAYTEELLPGASRTYEWAWTAPEASDTLEVEWTATATAPGDQDLGNNTLTAETLVQPLRN